MESMSTTRALNTDLVRGSMLCSVTYDVLLSP